jgi:toxin ParE1/3/4
MKAVQKLRRALIDLFEIATTVGADNPDMALRFYDQAEHTFHRIAEHPGLGHRRTDLDPPYDALRAISVDGFPVYLVFYREEPDAVVIIRVMHGARDLPSEFGGG